MTRLVINALFAWGTIQEVHRNAMVAGRRHRVLAKGEEPGRTKGRMVVVKEPAVVRTKGRLAVKEPAEDSSSITSGRTRATTTGTTGDRDLIAVMGKVRTSMQRQ